MPIILDGTAGITTPSYGGANAAEYLVPVTAFKNRIINGAMVIDQRNAGASVSVNNNNTFITDRFAVRAATGSGHTSARSTTAPAGFTNSLLVTVGTGGSPASSDLNYAFQAIEGFNIADLAWGTASAKTITISFQVRSSVTGTYALSVTNASLNRSYIATFTINSANTFETKSVTIAGDTSGTWATDNSLGLYLFFDLGCGSTRQGTAGSWAGSWGVGTSGSTKLISTSGATFYITGVQLEVGSTATSFDYRPYGTELALCQRYFEKFGNPDGSSSNVFFGITSSTSSTSARGPRIDFKVTKRAQPTMTLVGSLYYLSGPTWSSVDFANNPETNNTQCCFLQQVITGGVAGTAYTISTTAGSGNYITASAEL